MIKINFDRKINKQTDFFVTEDDQSTCSIGHIDDISIKKGTSVLKKIMILRNSLFIKIYSQFVFDFEQHPKNHV
jgi:hypothetical protein